MKWLWVAFMSNPLKDICSREVAHITSRYWRNRDTTRQRGRDLVTPGYILRAARDYDFPPTNLHRQGTSATWTKGST